MTTDRTALEAARDALPPLPPLDVLQQNTAENCPRCGVRLRYSTLPTPLGYKSDTTRDYAAQAVTAALSSPPVLPARPWWGNCTKGEQCVCGGDVPRVRDALQAKVEAMEKDAGRLVEGSTLVSAPGAALTVRQVNLTDAGRMALRSDIDHLPGRSSNLTLTEAHANHLRRLIGWVRCEVGQTPDELVQTVQSIAGKAPALDVGDEGKARLVQAHQAASNVPKYVRQAMKALDAALAQPTGEKP
jgi:hypothetical protein